MRICLVYHGGEFPPAERIEKMAATLTQAGHQIYLLCNNYGDHALSEEQIGDVHTVRVRPTFGIRKLNKILKFPVFLNPLWILQLFMMVRWFKIDAIQVIDLPLAGAAYFIGRVLGLPVLMDMWENYPEALKGWAKGNWKTRVFKNPKVARFVELWLVPRFDHVFVVVEEQKERLVADGVKEKRISVVTNAVDIKMFTGGAIRTDTPLNAEPGTFKLLYVGKITIERGLEDIIRAIALLRERMNFVRFYIAGDGAYEQNLRHLVEDLQVSDAVKFTGFVRFSDIQSYVRNSDVCVVPHLNNDFINTTMPNKLFQFMAMSKPVLVSNSKPLARVVRECSCGFVFESGNPADAARAITEAHESRMDASIGERGMKCVEARYTWDKVSTELTRVYDMFESRTQRESIA
jgi:glycosyltransferase involved in cell wall biosynthesis